MQLDSDTRVGVAFLGPGSELSVLVTAKTDGFGCVGVGARHTVTSHVECFKRWLQPLVVAAEQTEVGAGHEHEGPLAVGIGERCIGAWLDAELPVLDPAVELLLRLDGVLLVELLPVLLAAEERCRRSELKVYREDWSAAGVERLVDWLTGESKTEYNRVGCTVVHIIEVIPVLEVVPLIADFGLECECVIGPVESLTDTYVDTHHLEYLVGVVGIFDGTLVIVVAQIASPHAAVAVAWVHPATVVERGVDTGLTAVPCRDG